MKSKRKNKVVAIIPARGGSKSLPRKNVRHLGGKPLIAWPIQLAKSIQEIDRVIVSTDDPEIATIAHQCGAEIPFIRPSELAEDDTPTVPVLKHAIWFLETNQGYKTDIVILLYPTTPFLKAKRIKEAIPLLNKRVNSVIGVQEDWGKFWSLDEKLGEYGPLHPKNRVNRQYYKPLYRECGNIYFSRCDVYIHQNQLVDHKNKSFIFLDDDETIDIDTIEDFQKAENYLKNHPELK